MPDNIPGELNTRLLDFVWSTQPEWVKFFQELSNPYSERELPASQIEPLVEGFFVAFIEAWRGGDGHLRRLFVRDALASLLHEGSTVEGLSFAILNAGMVLAQQVTAQAPEPYREPLWDWFGGFFGALIEELHAAPRPHH